MGELESDKIKHPESKVNNLSYLQHKEVSVDSANTIMPNQSTIDDNQLNNMPAEEIAPISEEKVDTKEEISEVRHVYTGLKKRKHSEPDSEHSESDDCIIASTSKSTESQEHSESDDCIIASTSKSTESQEHSESDDCIVASTSESTESQQDKIASKEENIPTTKEEVFILHSARSDVCMNDASDLQDSAVASTSQLNSNGSLQNKVSSEDNLSSEEDEEMTEEDSLNEQMQEKVMSNDIRDNQSHRQNVCFSSDSSDSESESSSDSSDCDDFFEKLRKNVSPANPKLLPVSKTQGDFQIQDLPPVEDLHITANVSDLQKIGKVKNIQIREELKEFLVVVASDGNSSPLDSDSVLFLSSVNALGRIFEVILMVSKPEYVVRFNCEEDITDKKVTVGQDVYYSPSNNELSLYVLVDQLKEQKGSDASWRDNNEPPEDEIDYSDDEQERFAKQGRRRRKRHRSDEKDGATRKSPDVSFIEKLDNGRQTVSGKQNTVRSRYNQPGTSRSRHSSSSSSYHSSSSPSDIFGPGHSSRPRNPISPQPFGSSPSNNTLFHTFSNFMHRSTPSPQPLGPLPPSNVPSPQPFPHSNVPSPQPFGPFPHSNVPSPLPFPFNIGPSSLPFPFNNVPSSQPFGALPHSNVPSPQPFGPVSHNNVPCLQPIGSFLQSTAQSPQPFGHFSQSTVQSPQPFGAFPQSGVPPYQPVAAPSTSNVIASPRFASFYAAAGSPQQNPSTLMAPPQSNIPLQQQLLFQSQQPVTDFLSHPPPNYNSNENSRNFLHQNQPFAHPVFGSLPAARPTLQNISDQTINQIPFPLGTNSQMNLNISQPRKIMHTNSNQHQGRSHNMVQSNAANSFVVQQFPPRNTQPNNIRPLFIQPVLGFNQSPLPSPSANPFASSPTPPSPFPNQQGLSFLSTPHPVVLPSQTPPPIFHPNVFTPPVPRNQTNPQNYPYC